MAQTTHSRMDGAKWVADVLEAQKSELDQLADFLGEDSVSSARAAWHRKNYELTAQLITAIRERRKMRKSELEQLRSSFKAVVAQEILRFRTIVGAGQLSGFDTPMAGRTHGEGEHPKWRRASRHLRAPRMAA
jgi:hypothetical protein